jgi:GNAT superfamily N-acetyltransferase
MTSRSDNELYERGAATLLASWDEYAKGSPGAEVARLKGVSAAVFPEGPDRAFYNNALLRRGLDGPGRESAIEAMLAGYASAGVTRFAAWVHESDTEMRADLEARGHRVEETTRAMGLALEDVRPYERDRSVRPAEWDEYLRILEVPDGLLAGADPAAFHVLVGRLDDENVAASMAYDHEGDCGVFNVFTRSAARRRGIGSALSAHHLFDAAERGCSTASLQATPIAERVYAQLGFRDLGRFLEYGVGAG